MFHLPSLKWSLASTAARSSLNLAHESIATALSGSPFPRNFRTGEPYRGVNVLLLWASPHGYPFWLTSKQAMELKGSVRKGAKGAQAVFYKQLRDSRRNANANVEEKEQTLVVLCYCMVFNVEQCVGLTP
jgi:antirestriction protein ArdC